ncbi:PAS domain-containing protein [Solimonas soli]|uniref:PAS domain-containing protein n=1 Tax=Solimonas soli TaxID=413479 RepID=UPI00146FBF32|nr:PAS domain-containing protein [Solimonas soli]
MNPSPTSVADAPTPASPWSEALDSHGQGLWDWDLRRNRIWRSRGFLAALGYGEREPHVIELDDWAARLHPDDRARVQAELDAHLRGERDHYYSEYRVRGAEGPYRWVSTRGRVVARDESGRPLRMLGTQIDIDHQKTAELALRDGDTVFRRIFEDAPIGMSLQSPQGRWLDVNRALCDLLGYSEAELLQRRFLELTHPDDVDDDRLILQALLEGRVRQVRRHKRYIAKDGSVIPAQVDVSVVRDAGGEPQYLIAQAQDTRERLHYEHALRDEQELARCMLGAITDGVLRIDCDERIRFCNDAAAQLLGYEQGDMLIGAAFADVVTLTGDRGAPLGKPLQEGASWPPLVQLHNRRGEIFPVEVSLAPLRGHDGAALSGICVLHDVSHTRRLSEQLIYQASHDALTDLPNRREFEAELAHWISISKLGSDTHTLLYLDLDHFKLINETAGHTAGDRLVCELAPRLRGVLPHEAVLARTGGDEFAVLLPRSTPAGARRIAEDLLHAIEAFRFEHEGRAYKIAASIGICALDAGTRDANTALAEADTACYIAKRQGGHRIQLYNHGEDLVRQAFLDIDWASRIEQALENGGVELHGQRIVSLHDPALTNYEVLLRVRGDDGELQRPSAFLQAAERYGLAGRVDRWVVEQTLRRLTAGLERHGRLPFDTVSINLSGSSVSDTAFGEFLLGALDRHAVPPRALRFEITEGTALRGFAAARRLVARLREAGCRVMLDDFGSGFTSFDYLRQMTVDGLKIDQMYTQRLTEDRVNQTIVESICRISDVLDLEVVAEGVEDEATLAALRRLGVDFAQGHLYHTTTALDELLR